MSSRVGIEKLRVYPASMALSMERLCAARNHDPANIREVMMIDERSVNPPWEDPVTMAVNAALPMLTEGEKASIELLIVGSESASSGAAGAAKAAISQLETLRSVLGVCVTRPPGA